MSEFQEKLEKWGKEVAKECHNYAMENDGSDFYVFQSPRPIKENPDLLILGLNPGGDMSYKKQVKEHRKDKYRENIDDLCQDHHIYVYTEDNKFKIARTLSNIFSRERLKSILEESVAINRYYFNTKDGKMLMQEDKKILEFCKEKTEEVIKLIKPKCILTLGADNPLKTDTEVLKGLLWKGEYKGIPTYRIKHPSACWYNSDCALVGEVLEKLFEVGNKEDLSSFIKEMKEKYKDYRYLKEKEIIGKAVAVLEDFGGELTKCEEKKDVTRFLFANEILQVTFHSKSRESYISIRHMAYKEKYKEGEETYEMEKEFEDILKKNKFDIKPENQVWLGRKFIPDYIDEIGDSPITNSTIALAITLDIIKVVTLCNSIVAQDKK